ncbi:hypothetical protein OAO01_02870 [Oligoflexia bacterium]|nr:hypothetical protein [Oligoflexia bacterium]
MGFGIAARYRRCKGFWRRHLENSEAFQRKNIKKNRGDDCVAILGAGRGLDIDLNWLLENNYLVDFFDADPGCRAIWNRKLAALKAASQLAFHVQDLSGSLAAWTDSFGSYLKQNRAVDEEDIATALKDLRVAPFALPKHCSTIVSLNLLSQIPIFWRDRVQALINTHTKHRVDDSGKLSAELLEGIAASMQRLQEQHLELLQDSNAERILLLTDTAFYYYAATVPDWQKEQALYVDENFNLAGYEVLDTSEWFWDIAPLGIEAKDYGIVHTVKAVAFEKL